LRYFIFAIAQKLKPQHNSAGAASHCEVSHLATCGTVRIDLLLENHHAICNNRVRSIIARYIYPGAIAQRNARRCRARPMTKFSASPRRGKIPRETPISSSSISTPLQ
jgi:hypothetical protein